MANPPSLRVVVASEAPAPAAPAPSEAQLHFANSIAVDRIRYEIATGPADQKSRTEAFKALKIYEKKIRDTKLQNDLKDSKWNYLSYYSKKVGKRTASSVRGWKRANAAERKAKKDDKNFKSTSEWRKENKGYQRPKDVKRAQKKAKNAEVEAALRGIQPLVEGRMGAIGNDPDIAKAAGQQSVRGRSRGGSTRSSSPAPTVSSRTASRAPTVASR